MRILGWTPLCTPSLNNTIVGLKRHVDYMAGACERFEFGSLVGSQAVCGPLTSLWMESPGRDRTIPVSSNLERWLNGTASTSSLLVVYFPQQLFNDEGTLRPSFLCPARASTSQSIRRQRRPKQHPLHRRLLDGKGRLRCRT